MLENYLICHHNTDLAQDRADLAQHLAAIDALRSCPRAPQLFADTTAKSLEALLKGAGTNGSFALYWTSIELLLPTW